MAPENNDLDPVLAFLEARIADWEAARDSYLKAASFGVPGNAGFIADAASTGRVASGRPFDLPVGVFRTKGVKEAIVIYLEAARQKQTNKEIAAGILKGGIATTSENFEATVATALLRLKNEGVVLRFADGWDLAASYPDSLKNRLEKDAKPSKKRGKAKGPAKAQKRKMEARRRSKPKAAKIDDKADQRRANVTAIGLGDRVAAFLQTRGAEFTSDQELATQLGVSNLQVVRMTLGKMVKTETIERAADGRVRLVRRIA